MTNITNEHIVVVALFTECSCFIIFTVVYQVDFGNGSASCLVV